MVYTQEEVLDFVKEEDVKFIRLAFFDVDGQQKNISIMADQLPRAFQDGISFDASAIKGFETPDKSDLFLHPDPSTLSVLPWRPNTGKVVRMFCNIKTPEGENYKKDYRHLLQESVKKAKKDYGIDLYIGTEVEFYLFKVDDNGDKTDIPFDKAGYMDIAPLDKGENIRREICFTLEEMGITPEASHHEEGPGQNEIDFRYSSPLIAADNVSTFKMIVRTRAASNGLYADFGPKPLANEAGSGMHINISCSDDSKMRNMIAGILFHIKEMTYYLNPTEDSYTRLGKAKAPRNICWGYENRSSLIRVPATKHIKRVEIRTPDCTCNPYIAFSLILHAAMDGVEKKMELPEPASTNLFEDKSSNYEKLPSSLEEAKKIAESSDFIKAILG